MSSSQMCLLQLLEKNLPPKLAKEGVMDNAACCECCSLKFDTFGGCIWLSICFPFFKTSELRKDLRSAKLKPTSRALALPFRWSRSSPACDLSTMDSGWLRSSSFALPNDKSSRYGFSGKLLSSVLVAVCFYIWVLLFFLLLFEDVAVVVHVVVVAEVVVLLLVCDVA